ncbi:hypothetical protein CDV36_009740 [Fusarium kuroshium]|uniref:LTD domain-containing protein n=1 Tax=Fusarium kuroshium TaxID=2010991 RepID=A0A3M2RZB2_9HYPO|nr:hypothetical protein CDV36_009740 [Fusarium kuroshium]
MGHNLDEYISHLVNRAMECDATVYIFGQSDEGRIRNIHRNQGSIGSWRIENGRGADGGIFIQYPDDSWDMLLMAFLGQSISSTEGGYERGESLTNHMEGHGRIPVEGPAEPLPDNSDLALIPRIAIVALEFGKVDDDVAQPHKVHLCNMTNEPVPIKGWRIRFKDDSFFPIDNEEVLPRRGGRIIVDVPYILVTATVERLMLQDASEKTWDSVSITERDRERSGSMIYFGRWIAKRP